MVLIRHECGDASHWDWMLAPAHGAPDDDALVLESWRVAMPLHRDPPTDPIDIERGPLHRAAYLKLIGPRTLSGDRGHVMPVARGLWRAAGASEWELHWDGHWTGHVSLSASPRGPSWRRLTATRHQGP
jgi:hypothetical protein